VNEPAPVSRMRWFMRGLLLFALCFTNLKDNWSPDVLPNALLPFTLLREGDVDYDEFVFRPDQRTLDQVVGNDRIDSEAYFFRACGVSTATAPPLAPRSKGGPPAPGPNDRVCSVFPPGMGILAIPFFLPVILAGGAALDLAMLLRVGHVAAAFYETIAALLLWAVLRRIVSERAALMLILLYFLGTSVRTVASQALWQHAGVHLAIAASLWLVIRESETAPRRDFLAGLSLGLGGVVRQTTALVALGLSPLRDGWRRAATLLAGVAAGILPLVAYNAVAYGNPLEQGYGAKPFDSPVLEGLAGLLISPSRGLFIYEPWAIAALGGFVIAWFAKTTRGHISRHISVLPIVWVLFVALYATYAEWWGGRVFGPRFLDDLAPILMVGLAWGVSGGWYALGFMRVVFWLMCGWSVLIFNAAALVYDQSWDTVPVNVNDDPSKIFNWADPQWLAVLRAVPNGGPQVVMGILLTLLVLIFLLRVEGVLARRPVPSAR
jgi:hypothetical protein